MTVTDYQAVQKALTGGAEPAMLCTTCPWDRNCISPPTMTSAEVDARIKEASAEDAAERAKRQLAGEQGGIPTATLLTIATIGGRDQMATVCPVLALRLRSSSGKKVAELLKDTMQKWDDDK